MEERLRKAIVQFDLEAYIRQNFDHVVEASGGSELRIDCFSPKGCAGGDYKQHLWINPEKKAWICYRCGYGDHRDQEGTGFLPRFMADVEGVHISKIIERLTGMAQPTPSEELGELLRGMFEEEDSKDIEKIGEDITFPVSFRLCPSLTYLTRRGFTSDMVREHDVRYCSLRRLKMWNRRVIFPVRDWAGRLKSAVGRSIDEDVDPRWVTWPKADVQQLLWPLGRYEGKLWVPLEEETNLVVLVEGNGDALGVEKAGGYASLCTFGHKLSDRQVAVLQQLQPREVTLAWDYQARGKMPRAIKRLRGRFEQVSVFPYRSDLWKTNDFGDLLVAGRELEDTFVGEMVDRVNVDSDEYIEWEALALLG